MARERVVLGDASIVVDADRAAVVTGQVLRGVRLEVAGGGPLPVAQRHEQVAVAVEDEAPAPHRTAIGPVPGRVRVEQFLDVAQPVVLEPAAGDRDRAQRIGPRLHVAQIEQPVRREIRVQDRVAQPGLLEAGHGTGAAPERPDRRQALHGIREQDAVADDAEPAGTFRHEEVALGREGHRERAHEAAGYFLDPEVVERGQDDAVVVARPISVAGSACGDDQGGGQGDGRGDSRSDGRSDGRERYDGEAGVAGMAHRRIVRPCQGSHSASILMRSA